MEQSTVPDPWEGVQRIEGWAGESRVNTIRVAAVIGFYANHLYHLGSHPPEGLARYHMMITFLCFAGAVVGYEVGRMLRARYFPRWMPYATLCWDTVMVTTAALVGGGPLSPVVVVYFLILACAPLRLSRRFVVASFVAVFAGYNFLLGHQLQYRPDVRVPHDEIHVVYLAMVFTALVAGQSVRQARRIALGHPRVIPAEGSVT